MWFWKQSSMFKRWFLPILSSKSWFQMLSRRGNESRRRRNQVIPRLSCLNNLICSKHPRTKFFAKEHVNLYRNLGAIVGCVSSSLINSSDWMHVFESSSLNCVHLIDNEVLKFCHIVCEEEASLIIHRLIFIKRSRRVHVSTRLHRVHLI